MKLHYYPETDSLYIEFRDVPGAEIRAVAEGLNIDLDAHGDVVGFDIEIASERVDLTSPEIAALPLQSTTTPKGPVCIRLSSKAQRV